MFPSIKAANARPKKDEVATELAPLVVVEEVPVALADEPVPDAPEPDPEPEPEPDPLVLDAPEPEPEPPEPEPLVADALGDCVVDRVELLLPVPLGEVVVVEFGVLPFAQLAQSSTTVLVDSLTGAALVMVC